MGEVLRPADTSEIVDAVRAAAGTGRRLAIRGGGTRACALRPITDETVLDLSAVTGVIDYDPPELVLTAWAGTPLIQVEALLAEHGQMLAFEPCAYAGLTGVDPASATLGGALAANASGPRRILAGAARDHFLGFEAVSGRGLAFKAGGKVVKNVTGFDLPKLMAGSWGTLAVFTSVTVKVMPRPPEAVTLLLHGLDDAAAIAAMTRALGAPAEVSGATFAPGGDVALRLEGFGPSIAARLALLQGLLRAKGEHEVLAGEASAALWARARTLADWTEAPGALWRVSVPPASGAAFTASLDIPGARWSYDWDGGLVWLSVPPGPLARHLEVRRAAEAVGGHAALVRAPAALSPAVSLSHPLDAVAQAVTHRVKAAFDPQGVLADRRAPALEPA